MQFEADLIIVQECEDPAHSSDIDYKNWASNYLWIGNSKHKGLGIFATDETPLNKLDFNNAFGGSLLKWFLPFKWNDLDIVAIWTQNTPDGYFRYVGQLYQFIKNNHAQINEQLFIGDLNSNKIWDYKRAEGTHSQCVAMLEEKGIYSIYHAKNDEAQGEESQATFYLQRNLGKCYHIDYAFLPKSIMNIASISIGQPSNWLSISDHMPLVIDI